MWFELKDPVSGRLLYFDADSGECSWHKPAETNLCRSHVEIEWWQLWDATSQRSYFYNTRSRQVQWSRPVAAASGVADGGGGEGPIIVSLFQLQQRLQASPVSSQQHVAVSSPPRLPRSRQSSNNATADLAKDIPTASLSIVTTAAASLNISETVKDMEELPPSPPLPSLPPPVLSTSLRQEISRFQMEGYARQYFRTSKQKHGPLSSLFRRRRVSSVAFQAQLSWSQTGLSEPLLLAVGNKAEWRALALRSFQILQSLMGDRQSSGIMTSSQQSLFKKSTNTILTPTASSSNNNNSSSNDSTGINADLAQQLLTIGVNRGELRDELYCHLMKQLSQNPNTASVLKGWQLMTCYISTFPPSKDLQSYLHQFLVDCHQRYDMANISDDPSHNEKVIARYCSTRLPVICRKGPRNKLPTLAEIDLLRQAPFKPIVFGESIDDLMTAELRTDRKAKVPRVLAFLTDAVIQLNGCETEGIFRVPGDSDSIDDLRIRIDSGRFDLDGISDANVPASLLKYWIRELAEPVIPESLYDYCILNSQKPDSVLGIYDKLPQHHRNVLLYLINFLQLISDTQHQKQTRMNENNLAMVFAPNLLRCPLDNLQMVLENTKYEQAFCYALLLNTPKNAFKELLKH